MHTIVSDDRGGKIWNFVLDPYDPGPGKMAPAASQMVHGDLQGCFRTELNILGWLSWTLTLDGPRPLQTAHCVRLDFDFRECWEGQLPDEDS